MQLGHADEEPAAASFDGRPRRAHFGGQVPRQDQHVVGSSLDEGFRGEDRDPRSRQEAALLGR
jgi:hypothetical protein